MSVITKGSVWFCPPIVLTFSARIFCIDCQHDNPYNDRYRNVPLFKFWSPKNVFQSWYAFFFSKRLASGVSKKCIGVTSTIKDCFVNKISIPFSHGYIVSITGKFSEILCIFIHKRIILQRTLNVIKIRQRNLSHLIDC